MQKAIASTALGFLVVGALLSQSWAEPTVEIANLDGLSIGRDAITGQIELHQNGQMLSIDLDYRTRFYLHGAFRFADKNYMLVYDVVENKPSGSAATSRPDHNDLYEVSVNEGKALFQKVTSLPGGIDMRLRTAEVGNSMLACGTTTCLQIDNTWTSGLTYKAVAMPSGTQIIELSGQKVLLQKAGELPKAEEPIFSVCTVGETDCTDVPANSIPYKLTEDGSYQTAKTPSDFEDVLRYDYDRLGKANYSEPNLEARLVWSNVYYLNGLTDIYQLPYSDAFKQVAKQRLIEEFKAIAALGKTVYPGFKVRRYSVAREPLDFLLHFSRIAKTAIRAKPAIGAVSDEVVSLVRSEILDPTRTIEQVVTTPRDEVRYRNHSPFWADGSNVPWNYQNAWIEAISLLGIPDEKRQPIAAMVKNFVTDEKLNEHPNTWRYSAGDFYNGWVSGISYNTPVWAGGDKAGNQVAHISYRSMDALALLAAENAGVPTMQDLNGYVSSLIKTGYLYPFVNEGLSDAVQVPFAIARNYARSSLPWEFQNQVWAINSLRHETVN